MPRKTPPKKPASPKAPAPPPKKRPDKRDRSPDVDSDKSEDNQPDIKMLLQTLVEQNSRILASTKKEENERHFHQALTETDSDDDQRENEGAEILIEQKCVDDPAHFIRLRLELSKNRFDPTVLSLVENEVDFIESVLTSLQKDDVDVTKKLLARRLIFLSLRNEGGVTPAKLGMLEQELRFECGRVRWPLWWSVKMKISKSFAAKQGFSRPNHFRSQGQRFQGPKNGGGGQKK